MTKVLVLCPTRRDRRELALLDAGAEFVFHEYATVALEDMLIEHRHAAEVRDPIREHEDLVVRFAGAGLDAVISTDDYPGCTLACTVAGSLGLPAPSPAVNLLCQHKYESRRAQMRIVPEATPGFALLDTMDDFNPPADMAPPVFVKPVKSFFSIGAQQLSAWSDLDPIRARWAELGCFFDPFDRLLRQYTAFSVGTKRLLLESLLHGVQVTVEGYIFQGQAHVFGIVDSVMFPNTIVFQRFEYPSSLAETVQSRMRDLAQRLMQGIGFDNGMFAIEMMYDGGRDTIHIIEINPRMASQFADLYEKVDGANTYGVMLDIALGLDPQMPHRQGHHPMAASCVLRKFTDQEIVAQPSQLEIETLSARHPGLRVEAVGTIGERLSDTMQDEKSFRYGLIHLGGRDRQDILAALTECERNLSFGLRPLPTDAKQSSREPSEAMQMAPL
jgi:biotin carboxylase